MIASYTSAGERVAEGIRALQGPLEPASPLWAWATDAITTRAETMLEHLEGVQVGEDIEAVHDMRVWSRRLVAAMKVFESCFPEPRYRSLLREARQVTRRLGSVRDLDVLIDFYQKLRPEADPAEHAGIDHLLERYARDRDQVRQPMLTALKEFAASGFPQRVRRYLRREAEAYAVGLGPSSGSGPRCDRPFRDAAPRLLEERYRYFYSFEPYVRREEAVEELHEMRIAAKWLRYTMELFAPAYADGLKEPLSVVKKFQESLGDLHDSDIRLQMLQERLASPHETRKGERPAMEETCALVASLHLLQAREGSTRREHYRAFVKQWKKQEKEGFAESCLQRIHSPDARVGPEGDGAAG